MYSYYLDEEYKLFLHNLVFDVLKDDLEQNFDKYDDYDWNDLPKTIRENYEILGWNEDNWDGEDPEPASHNKFWDDLTKEEKTVARNLGDNEVKWNGNIVKNLDEYDDYDWNDLPKYIRENYEILGWNEDNWDGDDPEPASHNKSWEKLTEKEKTAFN